VYREAERWARAGLCLQGSTTLGSSDDSDIVVKFPEVESRHARLEVKGGRVYVMDLGDAAAGTYMDETILRSSVSYLMGPGSIIRLGGTAESGSGAEFKVDFEEPQVSAMDSMLADAFTANFRNNASAEVKKALTDKL
jgi:pSer/pThr/pTyr-binding forkhead associated (FHA) protein